MNKDLPDNTTDTAVEPTPQPADTVTAETSYTKDQVTEMIKSRVDRSHQSFLKRYGVESLEDLDKKVADLNELEGTKTKLTELEKDLLNAKNDLATVRRDNAFLRNNINPEKYNDIIAHFKGNELELTEEELLKALPSHPEWLKPVTTIQTLGKEKIETPSPDERERASEILGVDLHK